MSDGRAFHIRVTSGKKLCLLGHSPCIWHTELGCIAFPRIIRLQMISSRDVYKIVSGRCKIALPDGTWLFVHAEYPNRSAGALAVTLLVRPKLLQVYLAYRRCTISSLYVCFRVWVPDRDSILQNWPNESLVGPFLDRCWCSAEIPLEEGTSVVGLLGCLVDVLRPCTVLVESHCKVLCCISHLQHMPVDVVHDRRWLPCDSQYVDTSGDENSSATDAPRSATHRGLFGGLRCLAESGSLCKSDNHQQTDCLLMMVDEFTQFGRSLI